MELRELGHTRGEVSVIGQGTWEIDRSDRKRVVAALRRGLDLGLVHIDTAEMYGAAESIVGEAIDLSMPRAAAPSRPARGRSLT